MADLEVVGTLLLGIAALYRNALCAESSNLLTLKQQHNDLWRRASACPELKRLFQKDSAVLGAEPTLAEGEFLNLAFAHFQTGWSLARFGILISRAEIRDDVRDFLSYPLRRAVWERIKSGRNAGFVRFVEQAIERRGRF